MKINIKLFQFIFYSSVVTVRRKKKMCHLSIFAHNVGT